MRKPAWDFPAKGTKRQQTAWRASMFEWCNAMLDQHYERAQNTRDPAARRWLLQDGPAIAAARRGDIGPLHRRYPDLAEFLRPPALRRGQKYSRLPQFDGVHAAKEEAKLLRRIWREHYGKSNRPRGDAISAEAITAARHGVSATAVARRKPSGRHPSGTRRVSRAN